MTLRQAIYKLNQLPIALVAEHMGLDLDRKHRGECPSGHGGKSRNHFSLNTRDNYFKCFHCGAGGRAVKLWMFYHDVGRIKAVKAMKREFLDDIPINNSIKDQILNRQISSLLRDYRQVIWEAKNKRLIYLLWEQMHLYAVGVISEAKAWDYLMIFEGACIEIDEDRG